MSIQRQKEYLLADLASVDALLKKVPPHRVVQRSGLIQRKEEIENQISALTDSDKSAKLSMIFGGKPVDDSIGIDAKFASTMLQQLPDLIGKLCNQQKAKKNSKEQHNKFRLTETIHGSFGFELEEATTQSALIDSDLSDAVGETLNLINAASNDDDDSFLKTIEDVDQSAIIALKTFFNSIKTAGATCKLISRQRTIDIGSTQIQAACDRIETTETTENEDLYDGTFLGLLGESRAFEFKTDEGRIIKGKISKYIEGAQIDEWAKLYHQKCKAKIRIVTKQTRALKRTSNVLEALFIDDESPTKTTAGLST